MKKDTAACIIRKKIRFCTSGFAVSLHFYYLQTTALYFAVGEDIRIISFQQFFLSTISMRFGLLDYVFGMRFHAPFYLYFFAFLGRFCLNANPDAVRSTSRLHRVSLGGYSLPMDGLRGLLKCVRFWL